MYCTRCGKQIDYDAPICLECSAELASSARQAKEPSVSTASTAPKVNPASFAAPTPAVSAVQTVSPAVGEDVKEEKIADVRPDTRSEGFPKALISMIFSCANIFVGSFFVAFLYAGIPSLGLFFGSIYITLTVFSIVFGIKSISTFKNVKKARNPLPVKTLIFGIIGLALSAFLVYFFVCYYFMMETGVFDLYLNLFI